MISLGAMTCVTFSYIIFIPRNSIHNCVTLGTFVFINSTFSYIIFIPRNNIHTHNEHVTSKLLATYYRCMVSTFNRVCYNRVRLPILLVAS